MIGIALNPKFFGILLVFVCSLVHETTSLSTSSLPSSSASSNNGDKKYASHLQTKIASSAAKTERRHAERSSSSRPTCSRCSRPPILCVCPSLPLTPIPTSTHVLILQHPREYRRKSLSTVPLLPLVLENCTLKRGYNFEPEELDLVQEWIGGRGVRPLILFPGEKAISLDGDDNYNFDNYDDEDVRMKQQTQSQKQALQQLLNQKEHLLILIDGTWSEARRMIMQSKRLMASCQQIQFTANYNSIYDEVRKEPEKHCISTLEACAQALVLLERGNSALGIDDDDIGNGTGNNSDSGAIEAKKYLEQSMQYMVDTKRNVSESRNPEPRFTRPGTKTFEKNKRRFEIKQQLFQK